MNINRSEDNQRNQVVSVSSSGSVTYIILQLCTKSPAKVEKVRSQEV